MAKTAQEKLNSSKQPQTKTLPVGNSWLPEGGSMYISTPKEINEIMSRVSKGKVTTFTEIRNYLSKKNGTAITCPLTTAIFANIAAQAEIERGTNETPYWRTLSKDGYLYDKYPGGLIAQKQLLEAEKIPVIVKGKKAFVPDYHKYLCEL